MMKSFQKFKIASKENPLAPSGGSGCSGSSIKTHAQLDETNELKKWIRQLESQLQEKTLEISDLKSQLRKQ